MVELNRINGLFKAANINAEAVEIVNGLRIREYKIQLAIGERVSRIRGLMDELSLLIKSIDTPKVRLDRQSGHVVIETTSTSDPIKVEFDPLLKEVDFDKALLPLVIGRDMTGTAQMIDLADSPHLLIGGTSGAGKSVLMETMICSLVSKHSSDDLKLVLMDPKGTELKQFADSDYCSRHVVDIDPAIDIFTKLVGIMERRYAQMADVGIKKWEEYRIGKENVPYIVVIIDELGDLLMQDGKKKKLFTCLTRLLQKARAAGIHIIANTQRPDRGSVPGIIKANMPVRIALKTSNATDSRIILDESGAEKLVGKGDLLLQHQGKTIRIQGAIAS